MGSSSPGTQTVVNRNEPDPVTERWRNTIGNAAQGLYNQGAPGYYPGQTVVPFSDQTQAGLDMIQQQAMGGAPLQNQAYGAASRMMNPITPGMGVASNAAQGGLDSAITFNPWTQDVRQSGQTNISGQLQGQYGQQSGGFNPWSMASAAAGSQQTQMGLPQLQQTAQGGASNPYLDATFERGANQIRNQVDSMFARSGMTGSAAHQGEFQEGLNNLFSQIYMPAYESERDRQLGAANSLAGIDQGNRASALQGFGQAGSLFEQGQGRGLSALNSYAGLMGEDAQNNMAGAAGAAALGQSDLQRLLQTQQGNADTRLSAAQLLGNMYDSANQNALRGIAALPSIYSYGQMPAQDLMNVGAAYEGLANQYLADDMARYDYGANADWMNLARFSDMVNGLPSYGTQSTTSPTSRSNPALGALGGLSTGAGLLGALDGMGGMAGAFATGSAAPFVLGGSALLGLLGSRG